MIGFNHVAAGIIIALTAPAQYVPLLALISHFILDALPHFGKSEALKPFTGAFKGLLAFDAVICFLLLGFAWWLFPNQWLLITIGTVFATLPDFLWPLEGKIKWLGGYFQWAKKIQWGETPDGWTYELIYFSLLLLTISLLTP